jgi:hypothetical protein
MRAVLHTLGMQEEALFKGALPMAGGLGLKQETCGAIAGAAMCLGMASDTYGRSWDNFNKWGIDNLLDALNATGRFYDRCKEIMGGETNCRTITGMDIKTVADVEKYVATPNFETCCVNCGKIAKLAVETLLE